MKIKSNKLVSIFFVFIIFFYGIGVGKYEWFPFSILQKVQDFISGDAKWEKERSKVILEIPNLEKCYLPNIDKIPDRSIVIIGHAYGKTKKNKSNKDIELMHQRYISKKVEYFLENHREKIDHVIFTGDVFEEPSITKWQRLYDQFHSSFEIFVAPGNHDVGIPSRTDVFDISNFGGSNFKNILSFDDNIFIIENSIISNWLISPSVKSLIQEYKTSKVFLIRHNIPIKELHRYANTYAFLSPNLPDVEKFSKLKEEGSLIIISGDSGAYERLPRVTCHKFKNLTFITNGIGNIKGDNILIIKDGVINSYRLD